MRTTSAIPTQYWGLMAVLVLATAAVHASAEAIVFSDTKPLNANAASDSGPDLNPSVVSDGSGNWVAVWYSLDDLGGAIGTDPDILVARTTFQGTMWNTLDTLNDNAASDTGTDASPYIAGDGAGTLIVLWKSDLDGNVGFDGDIAVSRSTNNGVTWSAARPLNTNAATDVGVDGEPALAATESGSWVAVWESNDDLGGTIEGDYDILFSRSTNNGLTWTTPAALNTNAAADSGWDFAPVVASDGSGTCVAVWHSDDDLSGTIGTDHDILFARSVDSGISWSPPAALNTNAISDSGLDLFPTVATDRAGNWIAVWHSADDLGGTVGTDGDILFAYSANNGVSWSTPAAVNTDAASDSSYDATPFIATDALGTWVVAWSTSGGAFGTDCDIVYSQSSSNGGTWSPPTALNSNASSDSSVDESPVVATDGAGNWIVAWDSNDDLGGTIGRDEDIFAARTGEESLPTSSLMGLGIIVATLASFSILALQRICS